MKQFVIKKDQEGMRLSRFVLHATQHLPSSLLYKSFRNRRIKVNGRKAAPDQLLQNGDVIELYLNDEFFEKDAPIVKAIPKQTFCTIYEDENIAVLQKPAGLLSHSDENRQPGLLEAYIHSLNQNGMFDPQTQHGFRPAVCTRLDRNTEGVLLLAKTHPALRALNELIRKNFLQKEYLCLTAKKPPEGTFHAFLKRNTTSKTVQVFSAETPSAKPIATKIECLETKGTFWLCRVGLLTGRTHQIRAHLSYLGAPLLGDSKYGGPPYSNAYNGNGQALCAFRLSFAAVMPKDSILSYLAGCTFEAKEPELLRFWNNLS